MAQKQADIEALDTILAYGGIEEGNLLRISVQLSRDLYMKVDKILTAIGGKWSKSRGAHEFPFNPKVLLDEVVANNGLLPDVNPTSFFPTPKAGLDLMYALLSNQWLVEYTSVSSKVRMLEPSAGIGWVADYFKEKAGGSEHLEIDLVEILPQNQKILKEKGYDPVCGDFMAMPVPEDAFKYDIIAMNPPFSLKSDSKAYITHIQHAFKMLKHAGELVAVTPIGWLRNNTKKERTFRDMVAIHYQYIETLEAGTFKDTGTNIETKVFSLAKDNWRERPYSGWNTHIEWEFNLFFQQEFKDYDNLHRKAEGCIEDLDLYLKGQVEKIIAKVQEESLTLLPYSYTEKFIANIKRCELGMEIDEVKKEKDAEPEPQPESMKMAARKAEGEKEKVAYRQTSLDEFLFESA